LSDSSPAYLPHLSALQFSIRSLRGVCNISARPIALGVYLAIFQTLEIRQLEDWIHSEPTSIFVRRAWYLYELLMGRQLDIPDVIPSGYIDLLDPKIHLTGPRRLVRRQRINDNLLGSGAFSPLVRRTDTLTVFMKKALAEEASAIVKSCEPAILARAIHYLFTPRMCISSARNRETCPI
jgi:hypothetical protein